jgi:hypothetical protein
LQETANLHHGLGYIRYGVARDGIKIGQNIKVVEWTNQVISIRITRLIFPNFKEMQHTRRESSPALASHFHHISGRPSNKSEEVSLIACSVKP